VEALSGFLLEGARNARSLHEPGVALLLSAAMSNALNDATAEADRERRDALFEELIELTKTYADIAAVREILVKGLYQRIMKPKRKTTSHSATSCLTNWVLSRR
jgi:hypothetical protein